MGIPFLHPWANRLGRSRFELDGREVDLELEGLHVKRDDGGLPMHGLLTAARGWQVERHLELEGGEEDGGVLAASFDFGAYPRLLEAFPFPHRVEIEARLEGAELTISWRRQAGSHSPSAAAVAGWSCEWGRPIPLPRSTRPPNSTPLPSSR